MDSKCKAYNFTIATSCEITGCVYATSEEEAEELINKKEWEEIDTTKIVQIEDILSIKEGDD